MSPSAQSLSSFRLGSSRLQLCPRQPNHVSPAILDQLVERVPNRAALGEVEQFGEGVEQIWGDFDVESPNGGILPTSLGWNPPSEGRFGQLWTGLWALPIKSWVGSTTAPQAAETTAPSVQGAIHKGSLYLSLCGLPQVPRGRRGDLSPLNGSGLWKRGATHTHTNAQNKNMAAAHDIGAVSLSQSRRRDRETSHGVDSRDVGQT